jgi:hypothetical protein
MLNVLGNIFGKISGSTDPHTNARQIFAQSWSFSYRPKIPYSLTNQMIALKQFWQKKVT